MIAFVFTIKKNPIFFYFERISLMYGLMISFIVFFLSRFYPKSKENGNP